MAAVQSQLNDIRNDLLTWFIRTWRRSPNVAAAVVAAAQARGSRRRASLDNDTNNTTLPLAYTPLELRINAGFFSLPFLNGFPFGGKLAKKLSPPAALQLSHYGLLNSLLSAYLNVSFFISSFSARLHFVQAPRSLAAEDISKDYNE